MIFNPSESRCILSHRFPTLTTNQRELTYVDTCCYLDYLVSVSTSDNCGIERDM